MPSFLFLLLVFNLLRRRSPCRVSYHNNIPCIKKKRIGFHPRPRVKERGMARKWFFWAALTAREYVLHDSEWKKIVTRGLCLADRRPQQIEVRTKVPLRGPRHAASAASVWSLRKSKK